MSDEIGRAKIVVEADTEGVSASISDAKDEVESLGDAGESAGTKVGDGFDVAGTKIDESTAGLRKFSGAITGVIGSITGLVAVGTTLVAVLVKLASKAKAAQEEAFKLAGAYADVEQSINAYDLAQQDVLDVDDEQYYATLRQIEANKELTEEYKNQLIEKAGAVRESNKEVRKAKEAESAWKAYFEVRKTLEAEATESRIDDEELVYQARLKNLRSAFENSGLIDTSVFKELEELEKNLHEQRLENIKKEIQARIVAEDKAIAENERKEREAAERAAQVAADALERAMAPLIASLTTSFGSGFTTQLGSITNKIDEAVDELRKVKRGR